MAGWRSSRSPTPSSVVGLWVRRRARRHPRRVDAAHGRGPASPACSAPTSRSCSSSCSRGCPCSSGSVGFERLTRWHRVGGAACVTLLVAHAVLITAGYTVGDGISLPAEIGRLIDRLSRRDHRRRRARAARRRRRHLGRGRAAAAALRDVVLHPPLRLPRRSRSPSATSSRRARTSSASRPRAPTGTRSTPSRSACSSSFRLGRAARAQPAAPAARRRA